MNMGWFLAFKTEEKEPIAGNPRNRRHRHEYTTRQSLAGSEGFCLALMAQMWCMHSPACKLLVVWGKRIVPQQARRAPTENDCSNRASRQAELLGAMNEWIHDRDGLKLAPVLEVLA